jgi:Tol biopolymer transport system component
MRPLAPALLLSFGFPCFHLGAQSTRLSEPMAQGRPNEAAFGAQLSPDARCVVYLVDRNREDEFGSELFSAALDRSRAPVQLSGPSASPLRSGRVIEFAFTPDSKHVVYRSNFESLAHEELYLVSLDGTAPPRRLNATLPDGVNVTGFALGADGLRVLYRAAQDRAGVPELFAVDLTTLAPPVKLNTPLSSGRIESDFRLSADGATAVYRARQEATGAPELFAAASDASRAPLRLGPPLGAPASVSDFQLAPRDRVVFRVERGGGGPLELYAASLDASTAAVRLHPPLPNGRRVVRYGLSPDGLHVAYVADQDQAGVFELYLASLTGRGPATKLNPPLAPGRSIDLFAFEPRGGRIVYTTQRNRRAGELFSAKLESTVAPLFLNPVGSGSIEALEVGADGTVVYVEEAGASASLLQSVPIDGSRAPAVLNSLAVPAEAVGRFVLDARGGRVLYASSAAFDGGERVQRLFSAPKTGAKAPIPLGEPFVHGGSVHDFAFLPGANEVIFSSDRDQFGRSDVWRVRLAGEAAPELVSTAPPATVGDVQEFQTTHDGRRALYRADQETDEVFELYSVATQGRARLVRVSGPMVAGGDVLAATFLEGTPNFAISADDRRVVYRADQEVDGWPELYNAAIDGSAPPVRLTQNRANALQLTGLFRIADDSSQVLFVAAHGATRELYGVPLAGNAAPVRVNHSLGAGESVLDFRISGDSQYVVYRVGSTTGAQALYSARLDGSRAPVALGIEPPASPDLDANYVLTPDSRTVLFAYILQSTDRTFWFYAAPLDGSAPARFLDRVTRFVYANELTYAVDPGGRRLVYSGERDGSEDYQLFSAPIDDSAPPTAISGPSPEPNEFAFSEDGEELVYVEHPAYTTTRLLSARTDGSGAPVLLDTGFVNHFPKLRVRDGRVIYAVLRLGSPRAVVASPLDGSPATVLSESDRSVSGFELAPDGRSVAYVAHLEDEAPGLFAASLSGAWPTRRMNGPLVERGSVDDVHPSAFQFSADGGRLLYLADERQDTVVELFRSDLPRDAHSALPPR